MAMRKDPLFKILSFCIVAFLFATACNDEGNVNPVSTNSVVGYFITDEGTPISDAIVEATDGEGNLFSTSITNDFGGFEVMNVPENTDNALVSFVKDGTIIKQIKLSTLLGIAKKTGKADIFLNGEYDYDAVFAVKVIDDETDEPIEDAYVCLSTSDKAKFEATTNAMGYAYLPQIVPGRYSIHIAHNDYKPLNEAALLLFPEGIDTFGFTFRLTLKSETDTSGGGNNNDSNYYDSSCCDNTIKVRVLQFTNSDSANAVPFANCKVILTSVFNKGIIEKTTDNNGWVEFTDVCYGHHIISVLEDGYTGTELHYRVSCGETHSGQIFVSKKCCDNVLIVNYKDKNGNPINCGTAQLHSSGFYRTADVVNGTATFKELCNDRTYYFTTTITGCNTEYNYAYLSLHNTNITFNCKDTIIRDVILNEVLNDSACCNNSVDIFLWNSSQMGDTVIIEDADVEIQKWENNTKISSFKARFDKGVYTSGWGLCPGKYVIRIEACGIIKEDTFEVICNDHIKKAYSIDCD